MTADNHLGRYYDRMLPNRLEERRAWLRRGFAASVECALERHAHLFLHAGDLFDGAEPRNVERQFVARQLARLKDAGIPCLAIGGNHDTPRSRNGRSAATAQGTYAYLDGLRLLGECPEDGDQHSALSTQHSVAGRVGGVDSETLTIDRVRLAVGGIAPDPTAPAGSDPLAGLQWHPEADVALLMIHGSLEGHIFPGSLEPTVRRESVERLEGVDLLLAGHIHRYSAFRWGHCTVVIPGATERMTFASDEERPGFAYIEMEPGRIVRLEQVAVESQPRRSLTVPTSLLSEGDPAEQLMARLEPLCDPETMVRLSLEGPISRQRYHDLKLRELVEFGVARCFSLELDTSGLYMEDDLAPGSARGGRLSQREELLRYAAECREVADNDRERGLIDEALLEILEEYG
ncbi:MAG TPA: metallophosphoesterase [Chloroflexota bacterium]|nr:metallophosphoesterase [Chloroflexota bacterium]